MNERILKLALDAGLLNYVDNETPRHYFVHGHADLEEVERFAELIVQECASAASRTTFPYTDEFSKTHYIHIWNMACTAAARDVEKQFKSNS